jgi:hypothetical protein
MLTKRGVNPQLAIDAEKVIGELLPAEIVDQKAFDEYKRLDAHPILNEKRYITLSNGRVMSLGTATHHVKRFVENLPEEEQKQVLAQRKMWNVIHCKRNAQMTKAYGTTIDGKGRLTPKADKFILVKKEMIELFGRMFTAREVHELCVKEFQINCTLLAVMNFRDRNINEINARIEEHKRTFSDIRLGYKRSRLEELTWLYITRKRIYEATKKGDDHRLLLMTLEQLRKEIEGDRLTMDGTLNANIELTVQEHINKELFSNFPLKEIILARVAARANLEVTALLLEINKSYYHQFLHPTTEAELILPAFPSTQTYDFDRIRYMHQQEETNKKLAAPVTVISTEQVSTAQTVKEALLAKLKNKSQHINFNKEKLAGKFIDRSNQTEKED